MPALGFLRVGAVVDVPVFALMAFAFPGPGLMPLMMVG